MPLSPLHPDLADLPEPEDTLLAYAEGTLDARSAAALEARLHVRPRALATLRAMRRDRAAVASLELPETPHDAIPAALDEAERLAAADALRLLAASEPADAQPRTADLRFRVVHPARRRLAWGSLAAAAGLALAAGLAWRFAAHQPPAPPRIADAGPRPDPLSAPDETPGVRPPERVAASPATPTPAPYRPDRALARLAELDRALAAPDDAGPAAIEARDLALDEAIDLLRDARLVIRVRVPTPDAGPALAALNDRYARWAPGPDAPPATLAMLTAPEPVRAVHFASADTGILAGFEPPRTRTLACRAGSVRLERVAVARLLWALRRAGEDVTLEVAREPLDLGPPDRDAESLLWWNEPPARWAPEGAFALVVETRD